MLWLHCERDAVSGRSYHDLRAAGVKRGVWEDDHIKAAMQKAAGEPPLHAASLGASGRWRRRTQGGPLASGGRAALLLAAEKDLDFELAELQAVART